MMMNKDICRVLRREMLSVVLGSGFGAWLGYGIGKSMNLAIDGRLIHVEGISATLGLIAGYYGARLILPALMSTDSASSVRQTR